MMISIIIRTYNEERHIEALLASIENQTISGISVETIVVDSGSTDKTLNIAHRFNCTILHIKKEDFTFGYSLNVGCEAAKGNIFVFISGHCIPTSQNWLNLLCLPLLEQQADYVYGRQLSNELTQFSERQIFNSNFASVSCIPQKSNFCNNANAAMTADIWKKFKFDESVTGLEDLEFAQRARNKGYLIGYQSTASVFHIHEENWPQIQHRFKREAQALHQITSSSLSLQESIYWFFLAVISDFKAAYNDGCFFQHFISVTKYRYHQYRGLYLGRVTNKHQTSEPKRLYFWPVPMNDKR
jgi:glycosyltransferase involved in cell wall biosynthesis